MDALTHALTGSLVADALPFTRRLGRKAQVVAIAAAMAPDLDLAVPFIANFPPKSLSFYGLLSHSLVPIWHRTYTHSFLYTALAAIPLGCLAWRLLGRRGAWWQWAVLFLLAFFSHILLDITNIWDVRCWLPFSDEPVALLMMPLIDPLFTGLLAVMFLVNHLLRDPFAGNGEPARVLQPWQERSAARLDRLIGVPQSAWIAMALLVARVVLTEYGVFPLPPVFT